ncbi:hypothetical protein IHE44_0001844 [Lamprotornis superbus]|uniref:Claudin n=1 Tax=Lamprotornis superbus TaxID=245042 RepID=A0A835TTV8_9PASS|nr:hypothetical protein IHE44_0001844 [Lamprotornis superbus]
MSVTICQSMGFVVAALGVGGIIASTCMDQWSTQDLYNNPVTAVFNYQGLWRTCVRESSGFTECRAYFTILGLPGRARRRQGRGGRARHDLCVSTAGFSVGKSQPKRTSGAQPEENTLGCTSFGKRVLGDTSRQTPSHGQAEGQQNSLQLIIYN